MVTEQRVEEKTARHVAVVMATVRRVHTHHPLTILHHILHRLFREVALALLEAAQEVVQDLIGRGEALLLSTLLLR
jgi:hypothetical protein